MRFRAVTRTPVIDISEAETIGEVAGFSVDLAGRRVAGIRVGKIKEKRTFLAWEDLRAFGSDAVTVEGTGRLRAAADQDPAWVLDTELWGRRVLSSAGAELGEVDDAEFDPETGRLGALVVAGDAVAAERVLGFGSYALVVEAEEPPATTS